MSVKMSQRTIFWSEGNDSYRVGSWGAVGVCKVSKICRVVHLKLGHFTIL